MAIPHEHVQDMPHFLFEDEETPVPTITRIPCVVSGFDSSFSRKDAMMRHLRNKHKMQKDDPNYPGNTA